MVKNKEQRNGKEKTFSKLAQQFEVNSNQISQWKKQLSVDGRGTWQDNISVERLWKTTTYERVYLYAYDSLSEARKSIMQYLAWYNQSRPHSRLKKMTPDEASRVMLPTVNLAA